MCVYIYMKKNMFIIPVHSRNVSLNVTYGNYIVVLLYSIVSELMRPSKNDCHR